MTFGNSQNKSIRPKGQAIHNIKVQMIWILHEAWYDLNAPYENHYWGDFTLT